MLQDPALYDDLAAAHRAAYSAAATDDQRSDLIQRVGNVDVLRLRPNDTHVGLLEWLPLTPETQMGEVGNGEDEDEEGTSSSGRERESERELAICHLTAMWRYSTLEGDLEDPNNDNVVSRGPFYYGDSVGALLAVHHFNHGLGVVVDELENIHHRCNVRFTAEFFDTYSSVRKTVSQMTELIGRSLPEARPCAVLGAFRSAVSAPLSILTGVYDLPQLSPVSSSPELDDQNLHRLFSRVVPSDAGTSLLYVRFLEGLGVRHVGCLYANDGYGIGFHRAFKRIAEERGLVVQCHSINFQSSRDEVKDAIGGLAKTNFRYFFSMTEPKFYDLIMEEAYHQGIAGDPTKVTSWVFAGGNQKYLEKVRYPAGSALHLATQGTGFIQADGGIDGMAGYDRFKEVWSSLNAEDVAYLNSKQPTPDHITVDPDYFEESLPERETLFAYDSVVALGLAACDAASSTSRPGRYFTGQQLFDAFVDVTFRGATGLVRIDPETTSRDPESALYVIFNAVERPTDDDGMVSFDTKNAILHRPDGEGGEWVGVEGSPFLWADGGTDPPDPLPPLEYDYNYIGTPLRAFGLVLASVVVGLSMAFAAWTWRHRSRRVVRASQPVFLVLICAGTLLMGSAIVPLSIDDEMVDQRGASVACMAVPWLYSCGFVLSLSALFSKTWRVNKIFSTGNFRRISVTTSDVLWPLVLLMAADVTVLLVWTLLSPLSWSRVDREGKDSFGRTLESYGSCLEGGNYTPYFVSLVIINMSPVVVSNYQAYKSRKLNTEFSESRYIAMAMASILQASLFAIPVLIIVMDDPQARFLVGTALIFTKCMAILLLIFIPKMKNSTKANDRGSLLHRVHQTLHGKKNNGQGKRNSVVSVKSELNDSFSRWGLFDSARHVVKQSSQTSITPEPVEIDEEEGNRKIRRGPRPESADAMLIDGDSSNASESCESESFTSARVAQSASNVAEPVASQAVPVEETQLPHIDKDEANVITRRHSSFLFDGFGSFRSNSCVGTKGLRCFLEGDKIRTLEERVREKDSTLLNISILLNESEGEYIRRRDLDEAFTVSVSDLKRH